MSGDPLISAASGAQIEAIYKLALHVAFPCQVLVLGAWLYQDFHLPFFVLSLLPATATVGVILGEKVAYKDVDRITLGAFALHYGTYGVLGFLVTRHVYNDSLLGEHLTLCKDALSQSPLTLAAVFTASFLAADFLGWVVHFMFHKGRRHLAAMIRVSHLIHHSMTHMRLVAVRHNALAVLLALAPTCVALTLLAGNQSGVASAALLGLIAQLALNAVLTPFQHAHFTSALAERLRLAVGPFHALHHDDARGGSKWHFSVGIFSFWDDLMGTAMPPGQRPWLLAAGPAVYGRIGGRYCGRGQPVVRAFVRSQLGPVRAYLSRDRL